MIKKITVAFGLMLFSFTFFSCTDNTTEDVTNITFVDTLFSSIPKSDFTGIYDSADYTFLVNSISEKEFDKVYSFRKVEDSIRKVVCNGTTACMEAMEKYYIEKVGDKIQRKEDFLSIKLANGKNVVLDNIMEGEDYKAYQFLKLDENGFYVLAVYYYESYSYLLINAITGEKFETIGYPVYNEEQKLYVAYNYDMVSGFTFNGIEIIKSSKDSLYSDFKYDFKSWGPEEVKWKDDSTLYVKQKSQLGDSLKEKYNYVAIRIREKGTLIER